MKKNVYFAAFLCNLSLITQCPWSVNSDSIQVSRVRFLFPAFFLNLKRKLYFVSADNWARRSWRSIGLISFCSTNDCFFDSSRRERWTRQIWLTLWSWPLLRHGERSVQMHNFRKWRPRLSLIQLFEADFSNHSSLKWYCIWLSRSNYHFSFLRGK